MKRNIKHVDLSEVVQLIQLIDVRNNTLYNINILESKKIDYDIEVYGVDDINKKIKEILGL